MSHIISIKTGGKSKTTSQFDSADSTCSFSRSGSLWRLQTFGPPAVKGSRFHRLSTILFSTSGSGDVKSTPMPLGPLEPLLQARTSRTWCAGWSAKMERKWSSWGSKISTMDMSRHESNNGIFHSSVSLPEGSVRDCPEISGQDRWIPSPGSRLFDAADVLKTV